MSELDVMFHYGEGTSRSYIDSTDHIESMMSLARYWSLLAVLNSTCPMST